jgi:spermidine synthase
MIPWQELERVSVPGGGELTLWRRGDEFSIRAGTQELMNSRMHGSEESLAARGCAGLERVRDACVLVGGLGMGFTVRACLDRLGAAARIEVAELVPAVVRWNRGPLAHLAGRPLDDARVRVFEEDVGEVIRAAREVYDAILMDVDNGPAALTSEANARLYGTAGLAEAVRALAPGGVYALWSPVDDRRFTERLRRAGFTVRTERVPARPGGGGRHVLWLATRAPNVLADRRC